MRKSVLFASSSIGAVLVMALAGACGHSQEIDDAFEQSKLGAGPLNASTTGGGGVDTTCVAPVGPQFDCSAPASQQFDSASMKSYCVPDDVAAKVKTTLQAMNQGHKAQQMMGIDGAQRDYRDIERSPDVAVPGIGTIRGYRYRDAGHGVNLDAGQDNRIDDKGKNFSTVFPTASLRAASWDLDLEKRIGRAIGDETAASKNNMLLAPCMNVIRHPYWGRTQETYSEDTYHIGRMATAFTVGLQEYVVGCAKHYAANNIEENRANQDARMSEQTLREIYGRHFEMVIQDGAMGCIMASYNKVNGIKATQNKHLLRDVLKAPLADGGMGFDGLVLTDWWAMPGDQNVQDGPTAASIAKEAAEAGTDIEVPWTLHYTEATLAAVDQAIVNDAARRVLTQKYLFKSAMDTDGWSIKQPNSTLAEDGSLAANLDHEALAEEATIRSAVLLNNGLDGSAAVLPLTSTSIAVVGPTQSFKLISSSVPKSCGFDEENVGQGQVNPNARDCIFNYATDPALGDRGSSRVNGDPERSYGPFKGITAVGVGKTVTKGNSAAEVGDAEAVVVVVGYSPADEGEEYAIAGGGDRSTLDLPPGQNEFVESVLNLGKPTVIIVESGSIVNLPWLNNANKNQATIWAGYPGQMGGLALAKLIFGEANFSGKMPMAWVGQGELDLQLFKDPNTPVMDMGYFFGYREADRRKYIDGVAIDLKYPFGHGMSYSTFEYSNLTTPTCQGPVSKEAIFEVTVDITNTSTVAGDEIAMLFVKPPPKPAGITGQRPWKELKSFARVSVPAMGMATARLPVRVRDLRRWEGEANGKWVIDNGEYTILVAKDAEAAETAETTGVFTVTD